MKTLKLITLAAFALLFSQCKTTAPTAPTGNGASVLEVIRTLDTVQGKFYELAQLNLSSTPQQVMELTRQWIKTQPNVADASSLDSTYIDIDLKSGLRTTYMICIVGADSLCLTRGGGGHKPGAHLIPSGQSKNTITNKNVLILAPFIGRNPGDLYSVGELDKIVNIFKNSGNNFNVTLSTGTLDDVRSFGQYGLVIMDTHGLPDCFFIGQIVSALRDYDNTETLVKESVDRRLGIGGYDNLVNGFFRFYAVDNVNGFIGWQTFLKKRSDDYDYRLAINSKYINGLFPMPNTIIVGNFCYSGWSNIGKVNIGIGEVNITEPIKTAFTNKQPISYYYYGYNDGTSAPVDNAFAKIMEDSLVKAFVVTGDSTGHAYLSPSDKEYTGRQFNAQWNPDLLFKHFGSDDYSYEGCVDSIIDARDGQIYKAVCIGKQNWMKENLNYNAPGSVTYNNDPANGAIYGRLYDWATMMQGAAPSSSNPSGVQGVCPKGWHVPSLQEYFDLVAFIANDTSGTEAGQDTIAGGKMKAISSLWSTGTNVGATNASGFSALPGGYYLNGIYFGLGASTQFWMSDQDLSNKQFPVSTGSLQIQNTGFEFTNQAKEIAVSCRCVKDP